MYTGSYTHDCVTYQWSQSMWSSIVTKTYYEWCNQGYFGEK